MEDGVVTVGIVDDDYLVLRLLPAVLEVQGLKVRWSLVPHDAWLRLKQQGSPTVLAVGVRMQGMESFEFIRHVISCDESQIAVMLSSPRDVSLLKGSLAAGAAGYLLKTETPERIALGLRAATSGLKVFSSSLPISGVWRSLNVNSPLTSREEEVLELMAESMTNAQIARRLLISGETVKRHVSSILHKVEAGNRLGAVLWGVRSGLIVLK